MVISCRPTGGFARRRQLLGSGSCSPAVTINNRNKAYSSANYLKLAFTSVALPSPPSLPVVPGTGASMLRRRRVPRARLCVRKSVIPPGPRNF